MSQNETFAAIVGGLGGFFFVFWLMTRLMRKRGGDPPGRG
jgi:hypothetical protein